MLWTQPPLSRRERFPLGLKQRSRASRAIPYTHTPSAPTSLVHISCDAPPTYRRTSIAIMIHIRRRRIRVALFSVLLLSACILWIHPAKAQYTEDDYAEYVQEVLEEDEGNQHQNEYYHEDSYYDRQSEQQEEAQKLKQAEQERIEQEKADRIAAERERAFQAELDRMNAEQQKAALRQKKKDAQIVKSVLKASKKNDLYKALGIRNWNVKLPSRTIRLIGFSFTIPGVTLKETSMKDIRKAYRNRAMAVHPDKNKDGRAQEAFIIVEESASILSDNSLRQKYDEEQRSFRLERRQGQMALVNGALLSVQDTLFGVLKAIQMVLGPFATPVIILGLLMA